MPYHDRVGSRKLTIAAAQSQSLPGDIARNVAHHLRFARIAAEHGAVLLIFPELSLIGYELALAASYPLLPDSPALNPLRRLAESARMVVVAGAPLPGARGFLHIAAFAVHPDGSVQTYTKEHVHSSEEPVFTSGPGGPPLHVADTVVALAICRDASQPQHAAKAAAGGAKVYAAGVMVDDPGYPRKITLLQKYASEHRMAVLMANYSGTTGGSLSAGRSAIWSDDGQVVAASRGTGECLVIGHKDDNGAWHGAVIPV